ncbi:MAG: peptidyl-tRNA hydrolase [Synergistaceae bacterium]
MSNINQTILIRTDLFNLPEDMGLMAAQVAHIHMEGLRGVFLDHFMGNKISEDDLSGSNLIEWLKDPYILVKKVPNLEALNHFNKAAEDIHITVREWQDTVYVRLSQTMKQAFPDTVVGISLGPCDSDAIRTVVGDIPLL